jgi:hypothetical protein
MEKWMRNKGCSIEAEIFTKRNMHYLREPQLTEPQLIEPK